MKFIQFIKYENTHIIRIINEEDDDNDVFFQVKEIVRYLNSFYCHVRIHFK